MNGIQRIQHQFDQGKAFVAYLTAGDGGIQRTLEASLALIEGGVNMLELGAPFSDPIADCTYFHFRQLAAENQLYSATSCRIGQTLDITVF